MFRHRRTAPGAARRGGTDAGGFVLNCAAC